MGDDKIINFATACVIRSCSTSMINPDELKSLKKAANDNTLSFIKDGNKNVGYVAWIKVSRYTIDNYIKYKIYPRRNWERSDGEIVMLTNLFFIRGYWYKRFSYIKNILNRNRAVFLIASRHSSLYIYGKRRC